MTPRDNPSASLHAGSGALSRLIRAAIPDRGTPLKTSSPTALGIDAATTHTPLKPLSAQSRGWRASQLAVAQVIHKTELGRRRSRVHKASRAAMRGMRTGIYKLLLTIAALTNIASEVPLEPLAAAHIARDARPVTIDAGQVKTSRIANIALPSKARPGSKKSVVIAKRSPARSSRETILNAPLTRRKMRALNEASFGRERRILAKSAKIAESDILWIGLFHLVPLAAAESLQVEERQGILSLRLKSNAASTLHSLPSPTVTLAMGRNRVSGALIQAVTG